MVSPAPLAPAPPPLSYAERAKKAQNAKSQQSLQRSTPQGTSSIAPGAPSSSAARAAPIVSPPSISKSSSGSVAFDSRTSSTATAVPPISSSKTTTPADASIAPDPKPNGDVNRHGDSPSSAPASGSLPKQATAPLTNVWTIRKEQMAARALTQSRSSQPTRQLPAPTLVSPPPPVSQEVSTAPATSSGSSNSVNPTKASPSMASHSTNGHLAPSADYDDPFVVKPGRSPSIINPSPPTIADAESWPEVGQAAATPPNGKKESREEELRVQERETLQGHGSKKSEKTKWVPVPPEDLQFEGLARAQHTRQRSQNQDRANHSQPGHPSGAASSSSGQGSQQQSRTHSAAGRRPPPSHAGSVSHSQTQSRTGSVQSSPRHSSIRGGGRRLPDDTSGPTFGTTRSIRSSTTNSPSTYAQPQPLPAQEFIPSGRPYVNINVTQSGTDPSALSAIPDSAAAEVNSHTVYYPPQPPRFGVSPYHSPHPAGSPANNAYPLPPMAYPSQPGMPPPIPMSGYGTPPYPMYPTYGYPYGQPYMYWPPLPPQMMSSSAMTHAPSSDGVPPPTMLARPPPPNESDAVAGYRDVGFVLPPPAEHSRREQGEERGRRTRELSFGSISAGLGGSSKSPSPAPASPRLGAVLEGAALGLDVSGGQPPPPENAQPAQPQEDIETNESKNFAVFSIGVAPGEPGPTRLSSRTRTQSKGAATSVSRQGETPARESEGVNSSVEDPVVILTETVATVLDLTDSETKWEFGTTKESEVSEIVSESAGPPTSEALPASAAPTDISGTGFMPIVAPFPGIPPYVPPVTIRVPVNGMSSAPSPSAYVPRQPLSAAEDEWEVRDYGFGFGRGGAAPVYPQTSAPPRDDRPYRERGFQQQGEREHHYGRPRRGSYGQSGYGYERGGERGSYGGRRGRGLSGGYGGRGYQNRSYSGRGGYSHRGQQAYVPPSQPQSEVNDYYTPASTLATYIPQPPFESYQFTPYPQPPPQPIPAPSSQAAQPPMPVPQTNLGFPLDPTRYYLLGQLEYYLSAQNVVQDFFLRQQMDSRGWIPIALIASFNRVRSLTIDPQLVTDVLTLSSLVEVRGSYVRMRTWQQFVLPTAQPSQVEEDDRQPVDPATAAENQHPHPHGQHRAVNQNHEGDEEEEEDVEFVL